MNECINAVLISLCFVPECRSVSAEHRRSTRFVSIFGETFFALFLRCSATLLFVFLQEFRVPPRTGKP